VLEPHGEYNGSREFTTASASNITAIKHDGDDNIEIFNIDTRFGDPLTLAMYWSDLAPTPDLSTEEE
jgi:hypothetical protein